jgi:hypothetical protein
MPFRGICGCRIQMALPDHRQNLLQYRIHSYKERGIGDSPRGQLEFVCL